MLYFTTFIFLDFTLSKIAACKSIETYFDFDICVLYNVCLLMSVFVFLTLIRNKNLIKVYIFQKKK
jgi:hypothetical protein